MERQYLNVRNFPRQLISLIMVGSLAGCVGVGTGVTFDKSSALTEVNENTSTSFWTAHAQAGSNSPKYSISGADAHLFTINEKTGALIFKQPADYEKPLDNDRDNAYLIDITAQVNQSSDKQNLKVVVKDINHPTVALLNPKANANVGRGDFTDVEVSVKVFDEESKGPMNSGSVTVNTITLVKDKNDPTIWKGIITVPVGEIDVVVAAITADNVVIKETAKWVNKLAALKPQVMALVPGGYIATIDTTNHMMAKIYLSGMPQWVEYAGNAQLFMPLKEFDFSSSSQTIYFSNDSRELLAASIASAIPKVFYGGVIEGLQSVVYDASGKRLVVLTMQQGKGSNFYSASAVALNITKGFANAKTADTRNSAAQMTSLMNFPADVVKGKFKQFSYHRTSQTYIVADERVVDGTSQTLVQGFSAAGSKRFEAVIGGDISNLTVDETANVLYVAELSGTPAAKLKAINMNNGVVSGLDGSPSGVVIGSMADLRMDNVNKKLYVGDAVSDAIFVVDLTTQTVSELNHMPVFTGDHSIDN
jgi:hypothetical protein